MKHLVLHRLATVSIVLGTFFSAASLVEATTLTLPQQYQYPGLTFSQPLMYTTPLSIPQPTETITFTPQQNALEITKDDNKKSLTAVTLAPTKTGTKAVAMNSVQQPTPTIYLQSTKSKSQNTTTNPTPTVSVQPTQKNTTTAMPTVSPTPVKSTPTQSTPQVTTGGVSSDKLFSMVNSYRQSKGLAALQQDDRTCSLANARATEIAGEMSQGTLHSGMYGRNLPYWNTENAIALPSEEAALNWWINEPIHRQAIESPSHTTSCVACSGNYCVQEFTSYQPK